MSERDYIFAKADRAFDEIDKAMPFRAIKRVELIGNGQARVVRTPGAVGRRAGMLTSQKVIPVSDIKGAYRTTENLGGRVVTTRHPGALGRKVGMFPRPER